MDDEYLLSNFKKISTKQALKILLDNDIEVDEEELDKILDFLHLLVKITLKEFLS
ncbi:hypothetical protein VUJ46_06950 [Chryseobacterium sp. MYb264]|uniref:hypothetical protein n=1 Tax=Chryseobacterium sp. MYb264 TaxID=2745153 RepID=UPI002E1166EC|nr:hypothetical protein VUJ46_06950 [Chryseobacterium sp. MYb264]